MTADCVQHLIIWEAGNVASYIAKVSSVQPVPPVCKDGGDLANTAGAYTAREGGMDKNGTFLPRTWKPTEIQAESIKLYQKGYNDPKLTAETTDLSFKL